MEMRKPEIRRGMGVSATMDYSGNIQESKIRLCKVMRYAQACKSKIKTEQTVLQDYTEFLGALREQRTLSHFLFKRTKCAYLWLKMWSGLDGGCRNMESPKVKSVT